MISPPVSRRRLRPLLDRVMSSRDEYEDVRRCRLCPRDCRVDRTAGDLGFCGQGATARVASAAVHRGEEPPIDGGRGTGAVFFSGCTLGCVYCQNYPISRLGVGRDIGTAGLVEACRGLARRGVATMSFITAAQFAPHVIDAASRLRAGGIRLPIVWNTSGYETVETIGRLGGTVDVYLADARYVSDRAAFECSGARDYVAVNRRALRAMFEQAGRLVCGEDGVARRGLIVRHLVLPDDRAGTERVLEWVADELSPDVHVSIMGQYFPAWRAIGHPVLGRMITDHEYSRAVRAFDRSGLRHGWTQDPMARGGA